MCRISLLLCTLLVWFLGTRQTQAAGTALTPYGAEPWWNVLARRDKCLTPEEERLQKFWHDYYNGLKVYYANLDHIDWVAYYKNHGYQINAGCTDAGCRNRVNYAPVFINPSMQWAGPTAFPGALPNPPLGR